MTKNEFFFNEIIKKTVDDAIKDDETFGNFPYNEKDNFDKLAHYKRYIEIKELQQIWWEQYIQTKYYLKELVLNNKISEEEKKDGEERVFYDWLKICINSENDPNIDFYFQKRELSKEEQVNQILFDDKGKLRKTFENNEWQIRLRRIRTWFLKRYNLYTAIKLHQNLRNKGLFEIFDLMLPRLVCAILLGFIPLFSLPNIWTLPIDLKLLYLIPLAGFVFIYFIYECSKSVAGDKDTLSISLNRVPPIFLYSIFWSFFFSYILYSILSNYYIDFNNVVCTEIYPLKIIPFFAIVALDIGILIQIIWEDKTVTEPI